MTLFYKHDEEYDTDPYKATEEERKMTDEQKHSPVLQSNRNGVLCLPNVYIKKNRKR